MRDTQKLFIVLSVAGVGALLYLLSPVLTPFLFSALLAFMADPLADRLERHMPRTLAVVIVFVLISLVFALLLLILVPLIEGQLRSFFNNLPGYIEQVQLTLVPWLERRFGISVAQALDVEALRNTVSEQWQAAGGAAASVLGYVSRSGLALITGLANLVLVPVLTFYLLRDWDRLIERIGELLPRRYAPTVTSLARDSNEVLGAFLRGQLMVMVGLAALYSIGLWIIDLNYALLIGIVSGLVSFVPYLGFMVGITAAAIVALLQYQDLLHLVPVVAVFAVGQVVESTLLTPILVGDRIGLHPVAVIFAVLAGGQLFGFFGILLALPVAAVVMVILRHAHERYVRSQFYAQ